MLDEHFLVHSAIHKAVIRLLRSCVGDDDPDSLAAGAKAKPMGAAGAAGRVALSEYEEDRKYNRHVLNYFVNECPVFLASGQLSMCLMQSNTHLSRTLNDLLP
jgi:hypothetical protein